MSKLAQFDKKKALKELEEFRRTGVPTVTNEDLDFSRLGPKRASRIPHKKTTKNRNKT